MSQPPDWAQISRYCLQHVSGARVAKCGHAGGYRYLAYGPDRAAGWDYRAWRSGSIQHWSGQEPKTVTPRGEAIAQPRELLGVADDAKTARALCARAVALAAPDAVPFDDPLPDWL